MKHNNNNNPLRFPLLFFFFLTCVRCCTPPTFFFKGGRGSLRFFLRLLLLLLLKGREKIRRRRRRRNFPSLSSAVERDGHVWRLPLRKQSRCVASLSFLTRPHEELLGFYFLYFFPYAHPHHHHQFSRSSREIRWPTAKEENVVVAVLFHFRSFPPPPLRFILKEP